MLQLLEVAFVEVFVHGRLPPQDVLKALISKASHQWVTQPWRQGPDRAMPGCWAALAAPRLLNPTQPWRLPAPPPQGLGYGILAGSTLVKVPQLLNVVRAHSAEGLNPSSFELETVALLIATTYGFLMRLPFSAFGEVVVSAAGAAGVRPPVAASCCLASWRAGDL